MNKDLAISLDTETLGTDDDAPIIQVGGVLFDLFHPPGHVIDGFEFYVVQDKYNNVQPFAAGMNGDIMMAIGKHLEGHEVEGAFIPEHEAAQVIWDWVEVVQQTYPVKDVVFTGKQYSSFDKPKLERLTHWNCYCQKVHHRSPDPGSLYWQPKIDGAVLPNTATCMERAGIEGNVAHTAMQDATVVAELIQRWSQR